MQVGSDYANCTIQFMWSLQTGLKLKIHLKRISQTWRWEKNGKIKHLFGNVADETT